MADPVRTPPAPGAAPKKRRSCFGSFFLGGMGCLAFCVGALAALVLLAPRLLGLIVPGLVEDGFAKTFEGRLEVADVSLAWRDRQRVNGIVLRDPDGREVARGELVLPPLLALLEGPFGAGRYELELGADLVADDAGTTNLERALRPRQEARASGSGGAQEVQLERSWPLDLEVVVRARRITWSDATTRRLGLAHELRDVELDLRAGPDEPGHLVARATFVAGETSELSADARFALGELLAGTFDPSRSELRAELGARRLPVPWLDRAAGLGGALVELFGERADLEGRIAPAEGAGVRLVAATLSSERARIALGARLEDGRLTSAGAPAVDARFPPPRLLASTLLAGRLPEGAEVLWGDGSAGPWSLQLSELALALPASNDAAAWLAALAGARAHLVLEAPGALDWSDPTTRAKALIAGVRGAHVEATLAPDEPWSASLYATLDTGVPGDLQLDASASDVGAALAEGRLPSGEADLQVRAVSEAMIDALAGAQGCLSEELQGPVSFRATVAERGGGVRELSGLVRSMGLSANVHAWIREGRITLGEDELALFLRPPPGWFERCAAPRLGLEHELVFLPGDDPLKLVAGPLSLPLEALEEPDAAAACLRALGASASAELGAWRAVDLRPPSARAEGEPVSLRFTEGHLELASDPEAGFSARLRVRLAGGEARAPATLETRVALADPARALAGGELADATLGLTLDAVPEELLAAAGAPALAVEEGLALELARVSLRPGAEPLAARLAAEGSLTLGGLRVPTPGGALRLGAPRAAVSLAAGGALALELESALALAFDTGARLELVGGPGGAADAGRLRVTTQDLRLPLVEGALPSGSARVELGALRFVDAAGASARLEDVRLELEAPPAAPPLARLHAAIAGEPAGRLDLQVVAERRIELPAEGASFAAPPVALELVAARLPTALVDALAHQDGLLSEALGPAFDAQASGEHLSPREGVLRLRLSSPTGNVRAGLRLAEGRLEVTPDAGGAEALFGLGPLTSRRIVGPLVPLVVNLAKPEGAAPAALRVQRASFPLEAGLAGLDADLVLDLGQVRYELLPGLKSSFVRDLLGAQTARFAAIPLGIEQGVVHARALPLALGGGRVATFSGSYGLVDRSLALDGEVPLAALGDDVVQALGKARGFLAPDLAVPLEIRGTVERPKVRLGEAFIERALRDASRGLLESLLDKKKKGD